MVLRIASSSPLLLILASLTFRSAIARDVLHFHPSLPNAKRMTMNVLNESSATSRTLWTGPEGNRNAFHAGVERVDIGARIPRHVHDVDEILVIISGTAQLLAQDGVKHELAAMSLVVLPGGQWHEILNRGNEPLWLFWGFPNTPMPFQFRQEYGKPEL